MSYSDYEQEGAQYTRHKISFLVFPRLQMRMVGLVFLASLAPILMCSWAFYYLVYRQFLRLLEVSTLTAVERTEQLTNLDLTFGYLLFVCLAFTALMTGLSVYLSHRIAGPIYKISRVIQDFLAGDTKARVVLRKGDEFNILSDKVNDLMKVVDQQRK